MRKVLKYVVIAVAAIFLIAQFVRPDLSNPPVNPSQRLEASVGISSEIAAILKRSCNDCHTNETVYPWYAKVTPVNWWLKSHIDHGRDELNFSTWAKYTAQQQKNRLEDVCAVVEAGEMPLPSYLWGHREAALSEQDKKVLCDWAGSAK